MKKVTCLLLFVFCACEVFAKKRYLIRKVGDDYDVSPVHHENYIHKPRPYHFGYNIKDEKGNNQYHKEEGNEYNHKKGSYGYTDAYGIYRHVDYIADDKGFRAKIRTNEPGMDNYHPADVYIHAEQPPQHVNSLYHKKPHYPQEPLHHQEEEYEAYLPDAKERVYVPVYSPPGNNGGKEYYVR
ncbi:cuticle protein 14-like [Argiope bruennichi]|uniref:Cuticle protein 10.9 like protein n=1 Tax=Argiope bruennichi TaxID=94029 RepID=A0A8T0FLB0_ARGBR|nr:cuticle protein 14-like [Argiope bruennichi]KAF8791994.1 Cuticle protein 10.9 like protein [Argiope bruennichi]